MPVIANLVYPRPQWHWSERGHTGQQRPHFETWTQRYSSIRASEVIGCCEWEHGFTCVCKCVCVRVCLIRIPITSYAATQKALQVVNTIKLLLSASILSRTDTVCVCVGEFISVDIVSRDNWKTMGFRRGRNYQCTYLSGCVVMCAVHCVCMPYERLNATVGRGMNTSSHRVCDITPGIIHKAVMREHVRLGTSVYPRMGVWMALAGWRHRKGIMMAAERLRNPVICVFFVVWDEWSGVYVRGRGEAREWWDEKEKQRAGLRKQ